jgi:hypothetical protein
LRVGSLFAQHIVVAKTAAFARFSQV